MTHAAHPVSCHDIWLHRGWYFRSKEHMLLGWYMLGAYRTVYVPPYLHVGLAGVNGPKKICDLLLFPKWALLICFLSNLRYAGFQEP